MNPDIKAQWVEALRSGQYVQEVDKGKLHVTSKDGQETYCCLGVLCDLAVKAGVVKRIPDTARKWDAVLHTYVLDSWSIVSYDGAGSLPPPTVVEWAELDCSNPYVERDGHHRTLSSFNDRGTPFDVIADLIEEQL